MQAGKLMAVEGNDRHVLDGGVELPLLDETHHDGDFGVVLQVHRVAESLFDVPLGGRSLQHADPLPRFARLGTEVVPILDRVIVRAGQQLQLVDVVGNRRRHPPLALFGPLVAVEHDIDGAAVENVRQHFPLPLDVLGFDAELAARYSASSHSKPVSLLSGPS